LAREVGDRAGGKMIHFIFSSGGVMGMRTCEKLNECKKWGMVRGGEWMIMGLSACLAKVRGRSFLV
jgi:hypothetical protein